MVVEEKLDGANVSMWLDDQGVQVASRGGAGAMDRGRQLGPLRAWAARHTDSLGVLLAEGWAAYGEWLWTRHGTRYDGLPDYLVVLDCWHLDEGWASVADRDRRAGAAGLLIPPLLYDGCLRDLGHLEEMLGPSAFARSARAEGVVVRRRSDAARAKLVDPAYVRPSDQDLACAQRNVLAPPG